MAAVHAWDGAQPRYTHGHCSFIRLVSGVAGEGAYRLPIERGVLEHRHRIQWSVRAVVAHVDGSRRISTEGGYAGIAAAATPTSPAGSTAAAKATPRRCANTEIDIHPL